MHIGPIKDCNESAIFSINELLSSYEEEDEDEDENDEILENKSQGAVVNPEKKSESSKTKVSTELARRMLQKNLERLLLNQTESCKDVISQLTGTMTAKQVEKLVEKTNLELEQGSKTNKSSASQASQRMYLFSKEI